MKILVFGMLVEDIGNEELQIELLPDIEALREELIEKYPALKNRQFMIAVNKQKINGNVTLKASDEIALIPPFAGG